VIYFTMDGTLPTTNSLVYSAPIVLTNSVTIIAQALNLGLPPSSSVVTQSYGRVYVTDNLIPSWWLIEYFGANYLTNPNAASYADPDGDGQNNLQEYLAGTNPLDPNSVFKISSITLIPLISFNTVSNTTYDVMRKTISNTNWVQVGTLTATSNVSFFADLTATQTNSAIYQIEIQVP
jgi:hypothetical protein